MVLKSLHIPESHLYVSEPPPNWFGNGANERTNPLWTNANWLKSRFHFSPSTATRRTHPSACCV